MVPTILEWDGPVLATSIKADLVQDTLAARSRHGEAKLLDPTSSTGLPSPRINLTPPPCPAPRRANTTPPSDYDGSPSLISKSVGCAAMLQPPLTR